jgi:hypothetical protein
MMMQMMGGGNNNSGEAPDEEMKGPTCPVMGSQFEYKGHGAGGGAGACPFISSSRSFESD